MGGSFEVIRSRTNAVLKRARNVGRGKEAGFVLIEGERLIRDAVSAGHVPEVLIAAEGQLEAYRDLATNGDLATRTEFRVCADTLLEGLGSLKTAPGLAGIFREPATTAIDGLPGLVGDGPALILGVAGIQDPGNLGALVRVAEAAGAAAVVVAPGGARPFGSKALRGSMGSLFRVPIVLPESLGSAVERLASLGFEQCVGATRGGQSLRSHPFSERTVVWMTSETGEMPAELEGCTGITIPMRGRVESLNVTVAGALLLYAAASGATGRRELPAILN
ncbi:Putative TrmH family tRNA/rRNA methyltransferase [Planctomycetes bacterium Poly30]|uniref:TrmH family tRNA/rRNA methyltransferase n=1 Tax=Saltatorellus ferox TaxID=2528018 RepID=A0A518EZN6_9BACT|nr:Putative TrmH family tRNA/rRNA methyltransferase [Planctomycetes bacterium Poly30]